MPMSSLQTGVTPTQVLLGRAHTELVLHAAGPETSAGQSADFDVSGYRDGVLSIVVTDVVGTDATLDLELQYWDGLSCEWLPLPGVSIPQLMVIEKLPLAVDLPVGKVRLVWTIGGTDPSISFSVGLQATS